MSPNFSHLAGVPVLTHVRARVLNWNLIMIAARHLYFRKKKSGKNRHSKSIIL